MIVWIQTVILFALSGVDLIFGQFSECPSTGEAASASAPVDLQEVQSMGVDFVDLDATRMTCQEVGLFAHCVLCVWSI